MKKYHFYFLCLLFFPCFSNAQIAKTKLIAGSGENDIFIPPSNYSPPISAQTRSADITVEYVEDQESMWTGEAMQAFDYAVGLWEQMLTSNVEITIRARYEDISDSPFSTTLGEYRLFIPSVSYNFTSMDPKYDDDTAYLPALANKLAGMDLDSGPDIEISMNSDFESSFYFGIDGNCPTSQYDFVTVAMHEIGHGLGFYSGADISSVTGLGEYGLLNFVPYSYEKFLYSWNPAMTAVPLTDLDISTESAEVADFLTKPIRWNSSSDANDADIYAPSDFSEGSSILHLKENSTADENALMTPVLEKGEAIHSPGPIGIAILNDIGWEASLITGGLDQVHIHGFNYHDFMNNPFSQPPYITGASTDLNIGEDYYYQFKITNNVPPNMSTAKWKIEALYEGGRYVIEECGQGCIQTNGYYWWELNIEDLPNHKWSRNLNGQIRAEITIEVQDIDGYYHSDILEVGINSKPNTPYLSSTQSITRSCLSQNLSFYAPSATSYKIKYRTYTETQNPPIIMTNTPYSYIDVPDGLLDYTISGLSENENYEFRVVAINSFGSTTSAPYFRKKCKFKIKIFPNPILKVDNDAIFITPLEDVNISRIELVSIDNPEAKFQTYDIDKLSDKIKINISQIGKGQYKVIAITPEGKIGHETIIVF